MATTTIEWTDKVWNPVTGCTKVSQGCKHCYAERMAKRLAGREGYPAAPHQFDVTVHIDRLGDPLRWRKPRRVFVNSMSDLFHERVPDELVVKILQTIERCPQHTFQVLTKRAQRMFDFFWSYAGRPFWKLPNLWLGVSVEDQKSADERIPALLETPAAKRFLSCEPLLGFVDLSKLKNRKLLDWVIVGGESGPGARPMHPNWVRALRGDCAMETAFFFKQWGEWIPISQAPDDYHEQWYKPSTRPEGYQGCKYEIKVVKLDGRVMDVLEDGAWDYGAMQVYRVGKRRAGRLLDGREWNEMPVNVGGGV